MTRTTDGAGTSGSLQPIRLWVMAALMAAVYVGGTTIFSTARTEPLIDPIFAALFHTGDANALYRYFADLRYAVHSMQYFILLMLVVWVGQVRPFPALLICAVLAAADEGHQYFIPDRTCSLRDFKFDIMGAAIAFLIVMALGRIRTARREATIAAGRAATRIEGG